jgi:ABC-2 type transport system ATP-binding protein
MQAPPLVIDTHRLRRTFGATVAVDGLDLQVHRGEIVGMLGHNGAGKTTAVRLLNGVLSPSAGTATVLGLDPWRDGVRLRRRTGVATETPAVDDRLSGREGLTAYARLYGVPETAVARRVEAVLHDFDLAAAGDDRVGSYSRGMKQRLALARTLLHEPELLFLDEPTAGLDPVAARALDDRVRSLRRGGATILLCTHNLVQAQALCDRVVVLERGRAVAVGTPQELAADLAGGHRVTLEVDAAAGRGAVEALLAGISQVREVVVEPQAGDPSLLVRFVAGERDAVAEAIARLVQGGCRVYGATRDAATLEDVYFALHARGAVAA